MTSPSEIDPAHAQHNQDRGRQRTAARKKKRCDQARARLHNPMAMILGAIGELTPDEMWAFQYGPAHKVRAVVAKNDYLMELLAGVPPTLPVVPEDELKDVPRPTRVLLARHCGRSPIPFRGPPIVLPEPLPTCGEFEYLRRADVAEAIAASLCRFRILEACKRVIGFLQLDHIAEMAKSLRFVNPAFSPAEIEKAVLMLEWPGPYNQARLAYAATVNAYKIPVARGDWAAYPAEDIERLRPGIHIPKRLRRDHYLVKLIDVRDDEPQCLDFYSIRYGPLCCAPLHTDL